MILSGKILIVDDETNVRNTLTRVLKQASCDVTGAADGIEALRMLAGERYDLVYLDIRLPGMDGLQILRDIRQRDTQLPVILLTAHGSLQTAVEALRLGATDYLLKPVDPDVLVARTSMAIKDAAAARRRRELQSKIEELRQELLKLDDEYPEEEPVPAVQPARDRFLKRGALVLDIQARRATLEAAVVPMPPAAFDYLAVLARHSPDPVDYQALVTEATGYQVEPSEARELARYHIHVMRQALEDDSRDTPYIHTVRNVGYRLLSE